MTKPVETGANNGRCTLGGDCPIATNPHYHQTVPIVETGSRAQVFHDSSSLAGGKDDRSAGPRVLAECWTCPDCNCGYQGERSHLCTNLEPPVPLYTREGVREHKAAGHEVREVPNAD